MYGSLFWRTALRRLAASCPVQHTCIAQAYLKQALLHGSSRWQGKAMLSRCDTVTAQHRGSLCAPGGAELARAILLVRQDPVEGLGMLHFDLPCPLNVPLAKAVPAINDSPARLLACAGCLISSWWPLSSQTTSPVLMALVVDHLQHHGRL